MPESSKKNDTSKRKLSLKRVLLIVALGMVTLFLAAVIFLGEIVEYSIERYDTEYLGREVEMGDLDMNILFGTMSIDRLNVYELNSTEKFVAIRGLFADLKPWPIAKQHFELEEVGIHGLEINISHKNSEFNYDDLLDRFLTKDDSEIDTSVSKVRWKWDAQNIHIDSCRINYANLVLDTEINVYPFNLNIPRISSSLDTFSMHTDVGFLQGDGTINVDALVNFATELYSVDALISDVRIQYLFHYLQDYLKISNMDGWVNLDIHADGEVRDLRNISLVGEMSLSDLALVDLESDTVLALGEGSILVKEANYKTGVYEFATIQIIEPFINFEVYPQGDNLSDLVAYEIPVADSSEIDDFTLPGREYFNVFVYLADYARLVVDEYTDSDYKIDSIGIHKGTIRYSDYTLNEDVNFYLDNIELSALGFDTEKSRTTFDLSSDINHVGSFESTWSFDPRNVLEMDLEISTRNFLLNSVSPYSSYHTGYPFNHGDILYEGTVSIHDRKIKSTNRLFIEDINVGRKGFADPPVKLPVRLAVSILRDLDGNVDLEIPVEGDLDDPKFRYWQAIFQVLKNLLLKVATAPYRLFASMFTVDEDDLREIPWLYGQYKVEKEQRKRASSIRKVMEGKPEFVLTYLPINNADKEKDYLAIFESKSAFYKDIVLKATDAALTAEDTASIGRINNQDSAFVEYVRIGSGVEGLRSVAEMSRLFVGETYLTSTLKHRETIRDSLFNVLMTLENEIPADRIRLVIPDSSIAMPDTFNLSGPTYILGFELQEG